MYPYTFTRKKRQLLCVQALATVQDSVCLDQIAANGSWLIPVFTIYSIIYNIQNALKA